MLTNKIKELTIENYKTLQDKITELDSNYVFSTLNMCNWKYYDIKVFFEIKDDAVYIYSYHKNFPNIYIFRPIVSVENQFKMKHYYKEAILNIEDEVKNKHMLYFLTFDDRDFKLFNNSVLKKIFNSNYLYPTEQLKFMLGKKMQKKRNFVNYFKKNFFDKSKVVIYNDNYFEDVIEFCKNESIDKNSNEVRTHEIEGIKELLRLKPEGGFGSILFYEDKIIGFTYGVIHGKYYEIFVEKADESYKGSFQYLLLNNLQINNINTEFVDRQDDMDDPYLEKSKKSYKPIKISRSIIFEVKNI